ncbi:MAG: hypothetical protein AAGC60_23985 [Acidobacteriota bacterium]
MTPALESRDASRALKWLGWTTFTILIFLLVWILDTLVPIMRRGLGDDPVRPSEKLSGMIAISVLALIFLVAVIKLAPMLVRLHSLTRPVGRGKGDHSSPPDSPWRELRLPRLTAPSSLPSLRRIPDSALSAGEYSEWPTIDEAWERGTLESFSVPTASEIALLVLAEAEVTEEATDELGSFPLLGLETRVCDADDRWWSTCTLWSTVALQQGFLEALAASSDAASEAAASESGVVLWDDAPKTWRRAFLSHLFLSDLELTVDVDQSLDLQLDAERWIVEPGRQPLVFEITWLDDSGDFVVRARGVTLERGSGGTVRNVTLCFRMPREQFSPLHAPGEHVSLRPTDDPDDSLARTRCDTAPLLFQPAHPPTQLEVSLRPDGLGFWFALATAPRTD